MFKTANFIHVNIKGLVAARHHRAVFQEFFGRVQDDSWAFTKLKDENLQEVPVSMFCAGCGEPDLVRMRGIEGKRSPELGLRIGSSETALGGNSSRYSHRQEGGKRRYLVNFVLDEEHGVAQK